MKRITVLKLSAVLLLALAVFSSLFISCKKKDKTSPDNGEKSPTVSLSSAIWFADEGAYVDGVLNDSSQPPNMDMKLGKIYYAVIDTTFSHYRFSEEISDVAINIDISPSRIVDATVELTNATSLKESFILDDKSITLTARLEPNVTQKKYRIIIALTPLEPGEATVDVNVTSSNVELEGVPKASKTFSVNGSEIIPSPLEYTLSPDRTYYTVTGLGQTQGGIINVPSFYNELPVKEIGERAFYGYGALRKITLSEGIERVGASAFEGCGKLFDITLPSSITEVHQTAFNGCTLRSASVTVDLIRFLPKENIRVLYIRGGGTITADTLSGFNALRTLTALDEALTAEENALSELDIIIATVHSDFIGHLPKDTVMYVYVNAGTEIAPKAFNEFSVLLQVNLYSGIEAIGEDAMIGGGKLSIIYNNSKVSIASNVGATVNPEHLTLTRIGNFIYENGSFVKAYVGEEAEVVVPDIGYGISDYAFRNNKRIKSVFVPKNFTALGNYIFEGCEALETVSFDDDIPVTDLGAALEHCTGLKRLEIPKNINTVDNILYGSDNVETLTVSPNNTTLRAEGNCVIEKATGKIVLGCKGSVIPISSDVKEIAANAFYSNSNITSVYIPANITRLYSTSFSYCENIEKIEVAADNPIYEAVGNCLIEKSGKLLLLGCKTSVIPANYGITEICDNAFSGSNITSVAIPDGVKRIGDRAFANCKLLESVTLPTGLKTIGQQAFSSLPRLLEIKIPNTVTYVGYNAFRNSVSLTIYIQNGTNKSGWEDDWNCKKTEVTADGKTKLVYFTAETYN